MTHSRPHRQGYGARMGNLDLPLAVSPERQVSIETGALEAERFATGETPDEIVSDFGNIFARGRFSGGEGLFFAHTRDRSEDSFRRYWDSRNIEVIPEDGDKSPGLRLLRSTSQDHTQASSPIFLARIGSTLYAAYDQTVAVSSSRGTWSTEDPGTTADIKGMAVLGDELYIACQGDGVRKRDSAGTWTQSDAAHAIGVWSAASRVLVENNSGELREHGTTTTILTLPSGDNFVDVADGGSHILAAATDNLVYALSPNDSGDLEQDGQSPLDDTPTAIEQVQGIIFVATGQDTDANGVLGRLWRASLRDDGVLDNIQLIRQWGDRDTSEDRAPYAILGSRDAAFVVITNEDGADADAWRYDLAFAALVRGVVVDAAGKCRGVERRDGHLAAAIDGSGLWEETDSYAASGWLMGPLGDLFSAQEKSWASSLLEASVPDNTSVDLDYTTDIDAMEDETSTLWRPAQRVEQDKDRELGLQNVNARYIAGMVTLNSNAARDKTPRVNSFGFRAYPGSADLIVSLPVNVSDRFERFGRRPVRRKHGVGQKLLQDLLALRGRAVKLRVFRPEMELTGVVESVAAPMQAITPRGGVTMYSLVRVRGKQLAVLNPFGGMGVNTMGIEEMGL